MLENCLNYYGLDAYPAIARSLKNLAELSSVSYPCGYSQQPLILQRASFNDLLTTFRATDHHTLTEIFRYAALFGLIKNLVITPNHIEWYYNPFHKRDLFFAELRLLCRAKTASIL